MRSSPASECRRDETEDQSVCRAEAWGPARIAGRSASGLGQACGFWGAGGTHRCCGAASVTRQRRPSDITNSLDDQDPGAATALQLANDALEYQLLDRRGCLCFLDLTESSSIPRCQDDLAVP